MDLTAEFYLQTVDTVFVRHALPKGEMTHRGTPVDPKAIRNVALLTVEGENDDISGLGQTRGGARALRQHPERDARALHAAGGRPLRRVQRLAFPLRNRAAHRRFHHQLRAGQPPSAKSPGTAPSEELISSSAQFAVRCCKFAAVAHAR